MSGLLGMFVRKRPAYLTAPSTPTVSAHDASSITLAWTNGDGSAKIDIYRNGSFLIQRNAATTSYTDTGLSASQAYTYQLRHSKSDGSYSVRTAVLIAFTTLAAPLSLGVSVSDQTATLTWSDAVGGAQVHVYRDAGLIATVAFGAQTYADTGLADANYNWLVRSYINPDESPDSNTVNATVDAIPSDPTSLAGTPISGTENDLTWTPVDTAATAEVYRGTSSNPTTLLASVGANVGAYHDTTATAGTTYHYRVRNLRGGHYSGYSSDVSVATLGAGPSGPPTGLTLTTPFTDRVTVAWTNGDTAATTEIWRDGSLLHTSAATVTSYDDDSAVQGTAYAYKLRHVRNSQNSSYTSISNVTTPVPTLGSQSAVGNIGDDFVTLTWIGAHVPRSVAYGLSSWDDGDGDSGFGVNPITSPYHLTVGFTIQAKDPGVTHEVDLAFEVQIIDHTSSLVGVDDSFALTVYKDNP